MPLLPVIPRSNLLSKYFLALMHRMHLFCLFPPNLPTYCCQKHLYLLPSQHTPPLSLSVSKTGPLSAYLSAPIISKLQSCSDFHFSCLTATPMCTVLNMESSSILSHLCNIPSSASFPLPNLYSPLLVYPLGNANSHLPFFQSSYLYDNHVIVARVFSISWSPHPPVEILYFIVNALCTCAASLILKYQKPLSICLKNRRACTHTGVFCWR